MRFLFKWEFLTNRTNIIIIFITGFLLNHTYWHLLLVIPLVVLSNFIAFVIGYNDQQKEEELI